MNQEEGREKSWKRRGMMEETRGGKDAGKGGHQRRSQLRLRKKSLVKEPLPCQKTESARMHSQRVTLCKLHYARVLV